MCIRDRMKTQTREQSRKMISADTTITSRKKGFEYLNELFIRRHQRLLWKTSRKIALVSLGIVCAALLGFYLSPEFRKTTNELLMVYLPYFVFIMYAINRGTGFTQAPVSYTHLDVYKRQLVLYGDRCRACADTHEFHRPYRNPSEGAPDRCAVKA